MAKSRAKGAVSQAEEAHCLSLDGVHDELVPLPLDPVPLAAWDLLVEVERRRHHVCGPSNSGSVSTMGLPSAVATEPGQSCGW